MPKAGRQLSGGVHQKCQRQAECCKHVKRKARILDDCCRFDPQHVEDDAWYPASPGAWKYAATADCSLAAMRYSHVRDVARPLKLAEAGSFAPLAQKCRLDKVRRIVERAEQPVTLDQCVPRRLGVCTAMTDRRALDESVFDALVERHPVNCQVHS